MPSTSSKKVVVVAIITNLAIAVCKFLAAFVSGSSAMLAEAFHSMADTGNEILGMLGSLIALAGITLSRLAHSPYYDAGASMLIGMLVGAMGLFLARESGALLVAERPFPPRSITSAESFNLRRPLATLETY